MTNNLDSDIDLERRLTAAMCGGVPKCQCCGERNPDCTWRGAYQMLLCPECPRTAPTQDAKAE